MLVACDPSPLHSVCLAIEPNQRHLKFGAFIASDGTRATIASQVLGVLPVTLDTDELAEELSGRIAIFTHGRFLRSCVRAANPGFVFDEVAISTLSSKGITLESVFSGVGNHWIGRP